MIDLHALDNFARDHLQFEADCSRCFRNPTLSNPRTDAEIICGLDKIRRLVMQGLIDDACDVCEKLCSHPIEDPRIQLNVRIHKLFELVHVAESKPPEQATSRKDALQEALRYSQQLADFALNAFPEAYGLFTESMMLFAYPENARTADAIHERRVNLAIDLVSLTTMTVCARESCLSFLIRYLLLIYLQFKSPIVTPGEELDSMEELVQELLEYSPGQGDRTSRIMWKTDGSRPTKFNHRGEYKEADVQTLRERVRIQRQDSIESLRFTDGDVFAALKNELGRVVVNRHRFRVMVVEYCAARGLHVFDTTEATPTCEEQSRCPTLSDQELVVVPEHVIALSALKMFPVMCNLRLLARCGDPDAFLDAIRQVDPTLLESAPLLEFRIGQCQVMKHIRQGEFDSAIATVQQKLGPLANRYPEFLPSLTETVTVVVYASDLEPAERQLSLRPNPERDDEKDAGELDTERPRGARAGDRRVRHTRLPHDSSSVAPGNVSSVQSFDEFLKDSFGSVAANASLEAIAFEAYHAYEQKFKEPQLIQLLKRLLPTHEEWQAQNMMTDRFSSLLGVDEVRGVTDEGHVSVLDRARRAFREGGEVASEAAEGTQNAEGREPDRERVRDEVRENTVLTLMEFLAMSRAEALAVVRNHPHADNAQTIMDSLLGTML